MSFASETKDELARVMPEKQCCKLAELAGFIRSAGTIRLTDDDRFEIMLAPSRPSIARHYIKLFKKYFHIDIGIDNKEDTRYRSGGAITMTITPDMRSEYILRETGILIIKEGDNYFNEGVYQSIVSNKCCRRAYLRGVFLGTGAMSAPEKGYQLEFVLDSREYANDLRKLIHTFVDLDAKVYQRRSRFVVYMKNAQHISDMLAIMGAHSQYLKLEESRMRKELIGKVTRVMNCDNANSDRRVDAAQKQVAAIRKLEKSDKWAGLTEKLKELAIMRRNNPDASLTELGEMMSPPLGKSGVNNRMQRILEIADSI